MVLTKRKTEAIIWMIVWTFITILPIITWFYFGFITLVLIPFSGYILIKLIMDYITGEYD